MSETKDIPRTRGDTHPIRFTITSGGSPVDITGSSFVLTVSETIEPGVTDVPVMVLTGVIEAPATAGVVEFTPTEAEADLVGTFYYDVQQTDAGGHDRTVVRGEFNSRQDITKDQLHLWTAEGKSAVDGTEGIYYTPLHVDEGWSYTTRDGTPVLQLTYDIADGGWDARGLYPIDWPEIDFDKSFRLSGLHYYDGSWYSIITMNWSRFEAGSAVAHTVIIENEPGFRDIKFSMQMPDPVTQIPTFTSVPSGSQSWINGWLQWSLEWDAATKVWTGKGWQPPGEAEPALPIVTTPAMNTPTGFPPTSIHFGHACVGPAVAQVAWLKLEVLP